MSKHLVHWRPSPSFHTMRAPVSRPIIKWRVFPKLEGKKLIAVLADAVFAGSSLCKLPISPSESDPCQIFTAFCFSLEQVAKSLSSCDHEIPQMILEWASFIFLTRLKFRVPASLWNKHH